MATKTQIKKDLLSVNGNAVVMSISAIAKAMHMSRDSAAAILSGLPYDPRGKAKMYYVDDVATVLAERRML